MSILKEALLATDALIRMFLVCTSITPIFDHNSGKRYIDSTTKNTPCMAGNTFGNLFKLTTFGESHGAAIGGVLDGCPPGIALDYGCDSEQKWIAENPANLPL